MAEAKAKTPFLERVKKFFREYKSEFKKIVWPTGKEVANKTVLVITVVVVVAIFIGLLDLSFSWLFNDVLAKLV